MTRDDRLGRWKTATVAIAALTVVFSIALMLAGSLDQAATLFGFIPARASGIMALSPAAPVILTPLTATLVHAGMLHLLLNMMMLLFAGIQVERVIGASNVVIAYLVGAYAAAAAQWIAGPGATLPMVGASGAISAIFGIYSMLAAQPKQFTNSYRLNRAIHAAWLLVTWVIVQWMTAQLAGGQGMMLATPAHVGGFLAGLLLQRPLLLLRYRKA